MSIGTETISIHALREEGDPRGVTAASLVLVFLSTPSARRATCVYIVLVFALGISIHALREEGDARISSLSLIHSDFYPRPPRGGRPEVGRGADDDNTFLSTPSARRATPALGTSAPPLGSISIHALREEGDQLQAGSSKASRNFYPRPPRGGRLNRTLLQTFTLYFYPRPPRGGRP